MKYIGKLLPIAFFLAIIILFSISTHKVLETNVAQEKETLERALTQSITQCYALEGAYPPDIDYIKEHYGLTYNEEHFFIDYQYIGGNLRPDVTILERGRK